MSLLGDVGGERERPRGVAGGRERSMKVGGRGCGDGGELPLIARACGMDI